MERVDTELTLLTLSTPPPGRDFFLSRANLALGREGGGSVSRERGNSQNWFLLLVDRKTSSPPSFRTSGKANFKENLSLFCSPKL